MELYPPLIFVYKDISWIERVEEGDWLSVPYLVEYEGACLC